MKGIIGGVVFKSLAKGLDILVSETRWKVSEEGIKIVAIDPENIAMAIVDLPSNAFEAFGCNDEREIGVDIKRLLDITKNVKKSDTVEFEATDSKFIVKVGRISYKFELINPATIKKPPKVPEINYDARIVISPDVFSEAIKYVDKIGDYVDFVANEDGFSLFAEAELESIRIDYSPHALIEFEGSAKARYSVEYLKQFANAGKDADKLTIEFSNNYPVKLTFEFDDAKLSYILAPRIEAE